MEDIALNLSLDEIIKELDDKNLLYMTSGKIKELKNNILQKLYFEREELLHYHKVLKEYIYIYPLMLLMTYIIILDTPVISIHLKNHTLILLIIAVM